VNVALPAEIVPVPNVVAPSLNVTVPVEADGVTVAVNLTELPNDDGLREEATEVVDVALLMTSLKADDVLGL
jgi:hypothetical protein